MTLVVEEQVRLQYPRISVVIPARNEAKNLYYVLPFIPSIVNEIILVDGDSVDETIAVAQRLLPDINIIKQEGKGKGNALRLGFAACTGDIIVMLDADGSADPKEIFRFVEALLEGNDFAKGSRFIQGGGSQDITPLRSLGNYWLCRLVNVLFEAQFSDLCYGYNAFWKHCLDYIQVDCNGFEVETLINLRMHKSNLKIVEVPSFEYRRIWGKSNLHIFRDGWRVLETIIRERGKTVTSLWRPDPLVALTSVTDRSAVLEDNFVVSCLPSARRLNVTQTVCDFSVILCAYTEDRWDDLVVAVASVQQQTLLPREIIVVIDYNPNLLKWAQEQLPGLIVIGNSRAKGASGARNSAAIVARGEVLAFLDDDAIAEVNWIEHFTLCYTDPHILGVGGKIEPLWSGKCPSWFPNEFNWVIGCTYRGIPTENTPVRNVIGANMSVRRHVLMAVGGFRESFGNNKAGNNKAKRVSSSKLKWLQHHAGDEETEFCIRTAQHFPEDIWLYTPTSRVQHRVPVQRTYWQYFLWRCYDEGLGKALLVKLHGVQTGLSSERTYAFKVLPQGVICGFSDALMHQDLSGLARAGAIVSGFVATTIGYLMGSIGSKLTKGRSRIAANLNP